MTTNKTNRSIYVRIIAFIFWTFAIFMITNFITGVVVAALIIPNAPSMSQDQLMQIAQNGLTQFFDQYGIILHSSQLVVGVLLSYFGILPWTGKYKKVK